MLFVMFSFTFPKTMPTLIFVLYCRLLISFANSLDPDQARQNVGPDLEPNCLTLCQVSHGQGNQGNLLSIVCGNPV